MAEIDPAAAAEMTAGPEPRGLVWYVRALEKADDPTRLPMGDDPPRLSWVVLDETTGATLARGGTADPGGFPSTVAGLPVRGVADALEAHRAGLAPDVVAVAGWLRAWADPEACTHPIEGLPGGGCPRAALLVDGPWTDRPTSSSSDVGPHLHGVVPPGVMIPDRAVGLAVADLGPPPPVVVIGRFGASDTGCTRDLRGCDEQLTIEAVVWSSGRSMATGRQVAAGLVAPLDLVAASVTEPGVGTTRRRGPGRCAWCSPRRRTWRHSILPRRRSSVRPACDPRLRSGTSVGWRPTAPPSPGPLSSPARPACWHATPAHATAG